MLITFYWIISHKSSPIISILSRINAIRTDTYFFKIHFYMFLKVSFLSIFLCYGLSKWSVDFRGPVWCFWINMFLQCEIVSFTPNCQAEGSLLVGCPRVLVQYIRSKFPFLEAYSPIRNSGDAPCRGDRNPWMGLSFTT